MFSCLPRVSVTTESLLTVLLDVGSTFVRCSATGYPCTTAIDKKVTSLFSCHTEIHCASLEPAWCEVAGSHHLQLLFDGVMSSKPICLGFFLFFIYLFTDSVHCHEHILCHSCKTCKTGPVVSDTDTDVDRKV